MELPKQAAMAVEVFFRHIVEDCSSKMGRELEVPCSHVLMSRCGLSGLTQGGSMCLEQFMVG